MKDTLKFVTWPAIAGLLAALLILDRWVLPSEDNSSSNKRADQSYAHAVNSASPSVVNIYTAKVVTQSAQPPPRHVPATPPATAAAAH